MYVRENVGPRYIESWESSFRINKATHYKEQAEKEKEDKEEKHHLISEQYPHRWKRGNKKFVSCMLKKSFIVFSLHPSTSPMA